MCARFSGNPRGAVFFYGKSFDKTKILNRACIEVAQYAFRRAPRGCSFLCQVCWVATGATGWVSHTLVFVRSHEWWVFDDETLFDAGVVVGITSSLAARYAAGWVDHTPPKGWTTPWFCGENEDHCLATIANRIRNRSSRADRL